MSSNAAPSYLLWQRTFIVFCIALILALLAGARLAQSQTAKSKPGGAPHPGEKAASASDVPRGKYLVESVAMCGECHTPRDGQGNPDMSRWLQGAPVPFQPSRPDSNWPINAPRIGGTLPATDADMIKLLTTGVWTNGTYLRMPMPQFRLERSDAEAVVTYLKSVTPKP